MAVSGVALVAEEPEGGSRGILGLSIDITLLAGHKLDGLYILATRSLSLSLEL